LIYTPANWELPDIDGESGVKETTHTYFDIHTPARNVLEGELCCCQISMEKVELRRTLTHTLIYTLLPGMY